MQRGIGVDRIAQMRVICRQPVDEAGDSPTFAVDGDEKAFRRNGDARSHDLWLAGFMRWETLCLDGDCLLCFLWQNATKNKVLRQRRIRRRCLVNLCIGHISSSIAKTGARKGRLLIIDYSHSMVPVGFGVRS